MKPHIPYPSIPIFIIFQVLVNLLLNHRLQRNMPLQPSLCELRELTQKITGFRPCHFQLKFAEAILDRNGDVMLEAGCGLGKTLGFWMPLFARENGIQIIVTALNLLGKQNIDTLKKAGIQGINITAETATPSNFRVECTIHLHHNTKAY